MRFKLGVLPLLVVALGAYSGGYFALGCKILHPIITASGPLPDQPREGGKVPYIILRVYRHQWQADLFRPGAKVESWLRGRAVEVPRGL